MRRYLFVFVLLVLCLLCGCDRDQDALQVMTPEALTAAAQERVPPLTEEDALKIQTPVTSLWTYFFPQPLDGSRYDPTLAAYADFGGAFHGTDGQFLLYLTDPEDPAWQEPKGLLYGKFEIRACDFALSELSETYAELHTLMASGDRAATCVLDALPCYEVNRIIIYVSQWSARTNTALSAKLTHPERCIVVEGAPPLPELDILHGFEEYHARSAELDTASVWVLGLRLDERALLNWLFYPPDSAESLLFCPINYNAISGRLLLAQYGLDLEPIYVAWNDELETAVRRALAGFESVLAVEFPGSNVIDDLTGYVFPPGSVGSLFKDAALDPALRSNVLWKRFLSWAEQQTDFDPARYEKVCISRDETAHFAAYLVRKEPEADGTRLADVLTIRDGDVSDTGTVPWDGRLPWDDP